MSMLTRLAVALAFCVGLGATSVLAGPADEQARTVLQATGVQGGLIVHLGCGDPSTSSGQAGKLTAALRAGEGYLVHGLDADAANVAAARAYIQAQGLYGPVSVDRFDGRRLPYVDNLVRLVVADDLGKVPMAEVMRVLAPNGVAYVGGKKTIKPWPKEIDEWGHLLYDASGNPAGGDQRVGPPRHIQWECGPRWSRSHENMSSVSAVVSAGGRIFTIMDEGPPGSMYHSAKWFLTARDAFSGVALWRKPLDRWQTSRYPLKWGPFQLPRRLVALNDTVYVTLGVDRGVSEIRAATGEVLRTFEGTEATEEILHVQGKLVLLVNNAKGPLSFDAARHGKKPATNAPGNPGLTVRVHGDRSVVAVDLDSGKTLWKRQAGNVTPLTLAAADGRVFFHADKHIHGLDLAGGKPLWQAELDGRTPYSANSGPALLIHDDVLCFGETDCLTALSVRDGKTMWAVKGMISRCIAPVSICVIDDVVWAPRSMSWDTNAGFKSGKPSGSFLGYDLRTGRKKHDLPIDVSQDIGVMHHHCHMPKTTGKYLLTAWTGTEFVDTTTGKMYAHHWVRGACLNGILPANGLLYAPPNPCACYPEAKRPGFQALAPARTPDQASEQTGTRLDKGPAYSKSRNPGTSSVTEKDWPTHRHDAQRSGAAGSSVPSGAKQLWQTRLGGMLTQPVIAGGKMFVASVDTQTVHALDADNGRPIWSYQAGGRIDSSPTWYNGMVLFGARDGHVYNVNAETGELIWRFRAARSGRLIVSRDRLESAWPVPGNVLILNDPSTGSGQATAYFVAGKSSFLDGGLWLYRVNPRTGEKLSETCVYSLDSEGRQPRVRGKALRGLEMPGALPDVLSSDGKYVYLRHRAFDLEGKVVEHPGGNHIFAAGGFLDGTWFHRAPWTYGRGYITSRSGGGQGQGGGARIMVMDDQRLFYYGRAAAVPQNQRYGEKYFLSSSKRGKASPSTAVDAAPQRERRGKPQPAAAVPGAAWSNASAMHVRAMVLADQTLFVAGPKGNWMGSADVYEGRNSVVLAAVSASNGKTITESRLSASPVFDGMAAAGGKLYLSLTDGSIICLGGK